MCKEKPANCKHKHSNLQNSHWLPKYNVEPLMCYNAANVSKTYSNCGNSLLPGLCETTCDEATKHKDQN